MLNAEKGVKMFQIPGIPPSPETCDEEASPLLMTNPIVSTLQHLLLTKPRCVTKLLHNSSQVQAVCSQLLTHASVSEGIHSVAVGELVLMCTKN